MLRSILKAGLLTVAIAFTGCQNTGKMGDSHADHGDKKEHHAGKGECSHCAGADAKKNVPLVAQIKGTTNRPQVTGTLELTSMDDKGLKISGEIKGLKPNSKHGFHIHENGDCSAPDAASAGGHYNPSNKPHKLPEGGEDRHAGDLGNVTADGQGVAKIDIEAERLSAMMGKYPVVGRAFVLHASPDTGKGESGEAGARLACGVIGVTDAN